MKNERKINLFKCKNTMIVLRFAAIFVFFTQGFTFDVQAQNQEPKSVIQLNIVKTPLVKVFEEIEKQSNWRFLYNTELLKDKKPISLKIKSSDIKKVVSKCIEGQGLESEFQSGNVIVIRKGKKGETISQKNQTRVLKGRVIDKLTNEPLMGASVIAKEAGKKVNGVSTDMEGKFEIIVHKNVNSLEVSYIGYVTKTISVVNISLITVYLEEDVQAIDGVVITGYFAKPKSSFTGAITQITKKDIQKFGKANIISILSQVDPSFKIKENNEIGSDPNRLPDFFIRGEGSFFGGSNVPTFIVDGYEVSLRYVFDMDIERIESLSILKDASATIHYGSRAANGVVVIETRRPEPGELQVRYTNRSSFSAPDLTDYNLMNAKEKLEFERLAGVYTSEDPKEQHRLNKVYNDIAIDIARGVDTYWLSQPLRNAFSHGHSLYVSGGDEKVTYGLGSSYDHKAGVMKKSKRDNYGIDFDLTYRIKDKLSVRNSLSYSHTNSQNSPYGKFRKYATANPYSPTNLKTFNQHGTYRHYNYLYDAKLAHKDVTNIGTIINNLSIDYQFFENFRLKSSVSLRKMNMSSEKYTSPLASSFTGKDVKNKGYYGVRNSKSLSYDISSTLTHNLKFNEHTLYYGIGINIQDIESKGNRYAATGFLDERFNDIKFALQFAEGTKPSSTDEINRLVGFLGNVNYSYNNRYFADFSIRYDGSSKYGADSKFGSFWSFGGGWNIHREKFMNNVEWIEDLKIRGSVGLTGNQNFNATMAKTIYNYYTEDMYFQSLGAYFSQYGNKKLKWQKGFKRNIGLDFKLLERRLSLSFDYYSNKTQGLLLPVTVAPSLGFSSYTENYGEQQNKGYEFNISGVVLRNEDFDLAFYASGAHNKNKIVKISNVLAKLNEDNNADESQFTKPVAFYEEGESLSSIKAVRSMGIDPETGKELYLTKDGKVTDVWNYNDKVRLGDTSPTLSGNFGTNFMWRQFLLTLNFRYSIGSQIYNNTLAHRVEGVDPHINADRRVLEERWKKPGDHTFYKNIADRTVSNVSSRFVQDNDYLELSNVSLAYRFDRNLVRKWKLADARIRFNMNELFYLSTVKRERGLDYPFSRQFTLTLNLKF